MAARRLFVGRFSKSDIAIRTGLKSRSILGGVQSTGSKMLAEKLLLTAGVAI
jgi:hypothetical protein